MQASLGGKDGLEGRAALEWLCRSYWRPVHDVVRRKGYSPEDALDLTQGFFELLIESTDFGRLDQARGKFRSWVLGALHHFLINDARKARTLKRNEGKATFSLDAMRPVQGSGWEPIDDSLTPDKAFDRRWALTVLESAMALVEQDYHRRGAGAQYLQLKPFLTGGVEAGAYDAIAQELGVAQNHVAVVVKRLRERFRERVRFVVSETVASESEIEAEMQALFAALRG